MKPENVACMSSIYRLKLYALSINGHNEAAVYKQ